MNQKGWTPLKMLFALPVLAAVLSGSSAAASAAALCEEFRSLLKAPRPNDLSRYQLDQTVHIGGQRSQEQYHNLDVDGDDISDFVKKGCPGSTEMPADPCMLSIKLSSSGRTLEFEAWGFFLFRYRAQIFIAANADETKTKTNIYRANKTGFELVCAKL